jgi:2,4-dienoyl-CoA reductase-like NADH-dependent reductase (Old Yellow Enzyme family)
VQQYDAFIPGLGRLTNVIHRDGAKAALALIHPGVSAGLRYIVGEETPFRFVGFARRMK